MSLALCPQVVSQAPQYFRSSEKQATCEGYFSRQSICSAMSFPPACPGQFIHMSFRRWMSTIDTSQSELPIPLFTFCSILIESVRMTACVTRLSPLQAIQRRVWVAASTSTQTATIKMMMMIAFIQRYSPLSSRLTALACDST